MTSPYIKSKILQAIEHLRARKARPDLHRICNQLRRRHNCSITETTRCVNHLLDTGIIIKVEYKGSMSYRDASKWKRGHVAGHIINSNTLVAKLQSAIDAIVARQCDSEPECNTSDGRIAAPAKKRVTGATFEEIEAWLRKQTGENGCHLTEDALFEVLTREVETKTLKKSPEDGTYSVGVRVKMPPRPRNCSPNPAKTGTDLEEKPLVQIVSATPAETTYTSIDDKRMRPPSVRKRIKKYPDEIYELPPIKKSRKQVQAPSVEGPAPKPEPGAKDEEIPLGEFRLNLMFRVCNDKHQTETPSRHAGQEHEMLVCCGCGMKAHPDCLSYSPELLAKIDRYTWRCVTCKKCAVCEALLRTPSPMTCSGCDLAYHKRCHKPIMRKTPRDDWLCMKCTGTEVKAVKTEVTSPAPHTEETPLTSAGAQEPNMVTEEEAACEDEPNDSEAEAGGHGEDSWDSIPPAVEAAKDTSFPPTPRDSPLFDDMDKASAEMLGIEPELLREEHKVKKINRFDGQEFPDPSSWTVDQVYQFIRTADGDMYANGAEAFRREEIDGAALVLLKREEVLNNFALKVGPAVKLFRLIVNMRTNGNAHLYSV